MGQQCWDRGWRSKGMAVLKQEVSRDVGQSVGATAAVQR